MSPSSGTNLRVHARRFWIPGTRTSIFMPSHNLHAIRTAGARIGGGVDERNTTGRIGSFEPRATCGTVAPVAVFLWTGSRRPATKQNTHAPSNRGEPQSRDRRVGGRSHGQGQRDKETQGLGHAMEHGGRPGDHDLSGTDLFWPTRDATRKSRPIRGWAGCPRRSWRGILGNIHDINTKIDNNFMNILHKAHTIRQAFG